MSMGTLEFEVFDVFKIKDKRYLVLSRNPMTKTVGVIEYKTDYEDTYAGIPVIQILSEETINNNITSIQGNDLLLTRERALNAAPYLANIHMAFEKATQVDKLYQVFYTYGDTYENMLSNPKVTFECSTLPRIEGHSLALPEYMAYIFTALGKNPNTFIPFALSIIPLLTLLDKEKVLIYPTIPIFKSKTLPISNKEKPSKKERFKGKTTNFRLMFGEEDKLNARKL